MWFHDDIVDGFPAYNRGHNAISAVVHHLSPESVTIHTAIICSESSIARTWEGVFED